MTLQGVKLRRVDDLEDAHELLRWLDQPREVLSFDTETIGLEWVKPNFTRLVQVGDSQMGWTIGTHLWGWLIHKIFSTYDRPMVAHNLKFDLHALKTMGYPLPPRHLLHDTVLQHALLYPLEPHGLKYVSSKLLDKQANTAEKELKKAMKENGWTWATVPYEMPGYSVYGGLDTVLTARLHELLYPKVLAKFATPYEREMAVAHIMFETECRGLRVDLEYSERLHGKYAGEMELLLGKIQALGVANPNSNKQIEAALRSEKWEPDEFTKKGNPKLDKKVLAKLDYEVADLINDYRWREKYSSYLEKMLRTNVGGIVYPSINTFEAKTGRMSIGSDKKEKGTGEIVAVPFQQFPHIYDVRRAILPRNVGDEMYAIDYDSQEIRVLAHYSQEPGLLGAINQGLDMHIYTASMIYNVPYEDISKDDWRRSVAKMGRYLQVYGGGAEKLSISAGISLFEAERFKELDKQTFPGIQKFMNSITNTGKNRARTEGRAYIETWGGREAECDLPKIIDDNLAEFYYKLGNYIIQGSCADVLKEKLIRLDAAGLTQYIDLPVHDELVLSAPAEQGREIAEQMRDVMEDHTSFSVPLPCAITGPAPSWGHTKLHAGASGWDEAA